MVGLSSLQRTLESTSHSMSNRHSSGQLIDWPFYPVETVEHLTRDERQFRDARNALKGKEAALSSGMVLPNSLPKSLTSQFEGGQLQPSPIPFFTSLQSRRPEEHRWIDVEMKFGRDYHKNQKDEWYDAHMNYPALKGLRKECKVKNNVQGK